MFLRICLKGISDWMIEINLGSTLPILSFITGEMFNASCITCCNTVIGQLIYLHGFVTYLSLIRMKWTNTYILQSFFAERYFAYFDRDGNGEVDLDEFISSLADVLQQTQDEKLQFMFDIFDENGGCKNIGNL